MDKTASPDSLPGIVLFSTLLYRGLLRLGPRAFRREYALPALQDFRRCCLDAYRVRGKRGVLLLWPLLFGEGVVGLLSEHVSEFFGRRQPVLPTIRRSLVAAFWAFVLFALSSVALGRIADPAAPFNAVGRVHPEIRIAYAIIGRSFDIALLAVVLGGLPFLLVALQGSSRAGWRGILRLFAIRPKRLLALLGAALLIALGVSGYLLITEYLSGSPSPATPNGQPPLVLALVLIVLALCLVLFLFMAIAALLSAPILRAEFGTGMLRFALVPLALLTLTMAASTLATVFWTLRLWLVAPQFAASSAGLGGGQTAWVVAIILAMACSTAVTAGAFWRSWRSVRFQAA